MTVKYIRDAIEILTQVCRDEFSISLSEKDFERLYLELSQIQRYPAKLETGFRFPVIKVHGMNIKNRKYFKDIQKELNQMLDYITEDTL